MKDLAKLFTIFFKIGLFTFGGGLAMIPLIQRAVVDDEHWLTETEMIDCVALGQSLPGVIAVNTATYIGNKRRGILGALAATIGVTLPSFVIIILVVLFLNAIGDNPYIEGALTGVKAASCALIIMAAFSLGKQILKGIFPWLVATVSFAIIVIFDVNAIWAIVMGAGLGCAYQVVRERRREL